MEQIIIRNWEKFNKLPTSLNNNFSIFQSNQAWISFNHINFSKYWDIFFILYIFYYMLYFYWDIQFHSITSTFRNIENFFLFFYIFSYIFFYWNIFLKLLAWNILKRHKLRPISSAVLIHSNFGRSFDSVNLVYIPFWLETESSLHWKRLDWTKNFERKQVGRKLGARNHIWLLSGTIFLPQM